MLPQMRGQDPSGSGAQYPKPGSIRDSWRCVKTRFNGSGMGPSGLGTGPGLPNWVQRLRPTPPTRCMGKDSRAETAQQLCQGQAAVTPRAGCVALSSAHVAPTPGTTSLVCTGDSACASVPHQREAEGDGRSPEQAHSTPPRQMHARLTDAVNKALSEPTASRARPYVPSTPCTPQGLQWQHGFSAGSPEPHMEVPLQGGSEASLGCRLFPAGPALSIAGSHVHAVPLCGHGSQRGSVCQLHRRNAKALPLSSPTPRGPGGGEISECHAEHQVPSTCQQTESERDRGTQEDRTAAPISSLED